MKTFVLTKRIANAFLKQPIVQSCDVEARDLAHACERLTLSNEHISKLKRFGETSWVDSKDSTITVTLKEKELHGISDHDGRTESVNNAGACADKRVIARELPKPSRKLRRAYAASARHGDSASAGDAGSEGA